MCPSTCAWCDQRDLNPYRPDHNRVLCQIELWSPWFRPDLNRNLPGFNRALYLLSYKTLPPFTGRWREMFPPEGGPEFRPGRHLPFCRQSTIVQVANPLKFEPLLTTGC